MLNIAVRSDFCIYIYVGTTKQVRHPITTTTPSYPFMLLNELVRDPGHATRDQWPKVTLKDPVFDDQWPKVTLKDPVFDDQWT
jgi:hypothetical protein